MFFLRVFAIVNIHQTELLQCCSQSRPPYQHVIITSRIRPAFAFVTESHASFSFILFYFTCADGRASDMK